ncbi:hypothetical protein [Brucella pituitosa]|uniref:hypothetical protein n=1 Tax=Brucella pituitosa TaxID=571256 RepID=UPI003F4ADD9D
MKFVIYAVLVTGIFTIAGCTTGDQTIDTSPRYDRNGNPNFDTNGNYQGCNGIGCEVDNPDDNDNN